MLLPWEAVLGWVALAVVAALAVRWRPRFRLTWSGLALAAAGAVYYWAVMAHRPVNYYALFEGLASFVAIGAGLVLVAIGIFTAGPRKRIGDAPMRRSPFDVEP